MPATDGLQVLAELGRRGCAGQVIVSIGAAHGQLMAGVPARPFVPAVPRQL